MVRDKRFERIREGIYQELLKANQHFKICWGIRRASQDIARAIRVHLAFFHFTMWSNNDRFCLGVYNVVKPDDDTANFTKLFNYVRSSRHLSALLLEEKQDIREMEQKIESHRELIDRIKVIRDQYVAHIQLTRKHLEGAATYTYEEGKTLLVDLNDILRNVSRAYDRNLYWRDGDGLLDVSPSVNVDYVLRSLTERYEDGIRRRQGLA